VTCGWRGLRLNPLDLVLVVEFTVISVFFFGGSLSTVGIDARTYWLAANRWLSGQDPYADLGSLVFAAPPPTLAVLAPFAALPLPMFASLLLAASVVAAIYLLRKLRLPYWYLLFPPIVEGLVVGNPNVIVVALLVAAIPAGDVIGTFLKAYGAVPLLFLNRQRSLHWVAVALLVTAPFLPWLTYLSHAVELVNVLDVQSSGGRSALAYPVLVPFTIIALVLLGRRRAAWLTVPALWPATQFHYGVFALPVAGRLMAAILAVPLPGIPAVAVIVEAVAELWRRRRRDPNGSLTSESG
jgi:hypothetical protein